jgi:hypothetical protein
MYAIEKHQFHISLCAPPVPTMTAHQERLHGTLGTERPCTGRALRYARGSARGLAIGPPRGEVCAPHPGQPSGPVRAIGSASGEHQSHERKYESIEMIRKNSHRKDKKGTLKASVSAVMNYIIAIIINNIHHRSMKTESQRKSNREYLKMFHRRQVDTGHHLVNVYIPSELVLLIDAEKEHDMLRGRGPIITKALEYYFSHNKPRA